MWIKILSNRAGQIALKSLFGFFILILVGVFSLMVLPALAWTEPSAAPPGNNVYAPVNLGPTFQTKSGSLNIEGNSSPVLGFMVGRGDLTLGTGKNLIYGNMKNTSVGNFLLFSSCTGSQDATCDSAVNVFSLGVDGWLSTRGPIGISQDITPERFLVTSGGDIQRIRAIYYSWPGSQASGIQCLQNDGIGNLSWAACATGGSGTPGGSNTQVQFNDNGSFGGDSNFVWNNTNKRLGIGTTSPGYRLTVPWITGDSVATAYFGSGNASNNSIAVFGESYSGYGVSGTSASSTGVRGVSTSGTGVLGVSTSSYGVYGLTTSGLGVHGMSTDGIGVSGSSTNSYAGYFDINPATTNAVAETLRLQRNTSGTAAAGIGGSLNIYTENSVGAGVLTGSIANLLTNAASGSETSALTFWTMANGTPMAAEKVRIDGDGNVGIGETNPGYPLDIKNSTNTGTAEIRLNQNNATSLWTGLAMSRQSAEKWFVGMDNAVDATANSLIFRRNGTTNDMTIGTDGTVNMAGQIKIAGGSPGANKVLTSDADGLATWQTPAASSGGSPVGSIIMYGGTAAPSGWFLCDGRLYDTIVYADLFAVIGYNFGGGGPMFMVPNFQDRFPKGTMGGITGTIGGQASITPIFTGSALSTHQHAAISAGTPSGSISAVTIDPPFVLVNYIIKYQN